MRVRRVGLNCSAAKGSFHQFVQGVPGVDLYCPFVAAFGGFVIYSKCVSLLGDYCANFIPWEYYTLSLELTTVGFLSCQTTRDTE